MNSQSVLVGLSGGVDSFVTALMLQRQGYHVVGVNLLLWDTVVSRELTDMCGKIGIGLIHYDGRALFRCQVVEPFIRGYADGRTPNPCAVCNSIVKWNLLLQLADKQGVEYVATGHYVRIERESIFYYIRKGVDPVKDQSYFLWGVPQSVLSRALTPLGDYTKTEVKAYASANGYKEIADKRESMGICFLEGEDYRNFIERNISAGVMKGSGEIINTDGRVIDRHSGLLNYTVGQKRGMPLLNDRPLYVACIDVKNNRIMADFKENLYTETLEVGQLCVVNRQELSAENIEVKIRGLGLNPQGFVRISELSANRLAVRLASPAWAVASGQPVAFYRGERLIGGGIVC